MKNHLLTFKISSSKHCSTLTRVFALHSRKRHPYCLAKSIPSFFETTLSASCNTCYWLILTDHVFESLWIQCKLTKNGIIRRENAGVAQWIHWKTSNLIPKLSVWYAIELPKKMYLVNFVADEHLDAVWISRVQINLLWPYLRKIRECFSSCHIIHYKSQGHNNL